MPKPTPAQLLKLSLKPFMWVAHFRNYLISESDMHWSKVPNKHLIEKMMIYDRCHHKFHKYLIPEKCRPFIINDATFDLASGQRTLLGMAVGVLLNKRGDYKYIYVSSNGQCKEGSNNFLKPTSPFDFPPALNLDVQGVKIDELPD